MATIRDVSQLAKVSQATASRVLSGNVPASPSKRSAVLAAIEQLGHQPNAFARPSEDEGIPRTRFWVQDDETTHQR